MAIISITITPSSVQVLPGIPKYIELTTNEHAIIFYSLDGSTPNNGSPIYTTPILLPSSMTTITLSIFATNGIDNSAVIVQTYTADISIIETTATDRVPHSATTNLNNVSSNNSLFPFGTNSPNPDYQYLGAANAGTTVYTEGNTNAVSQGFDSNNNPAVFTNNPTAYYQFNEQYSTTDVEGQVFPGVGNLPAQTTVIGDPYAEEYRQEMSTTADKVFNPRALVIYQDTTNEDPTNPVIINKPHMSLENPEIVRDGDLLYNSGVDIPPVAGGFVNRHYNSRTNMFTSSYYDNTVHRWIFSSTPYQPTTNNIGALYNMVFSRSGPSDINGISGGSKYVHTWQWNRRRILF
jgi:hypothetical protein